MVRKSWLYFIDSLKFFIYSKHTHAHILYIFVLLKHNESELKRQGFYAVSASLLLSIFNLQFFQGNK